MSTSTIHSTEEHDPKLHPHYHAPQKQLLTTTTATVSRTTSEKRFWALIVCMLVVSFIVILCAVFIPSKRVDQSSLTSSTATTGASNPSLPVCSPSSTSQECTTTKTTATITAAPGSTTNEMSSTKETDTTGSSTSATFVKTTTTSVPTLVLTEISTLSPTSTATEPVLPRNPSTTAPLKSANSVVVCNICGDDMVVGAPSNQVQDPVSGERMKCSELQVRGRQGFFEPMQCKMIEASSRFPCLCQEPSPTSMPFNGPSPAPTNLRSSNATNKATSTPAEIVIENNPMLNPSIQPSSKPTESPLQSPETSPMDYYPGRLNVYENGLILSQGLTARIFAETGKAVQYANGGNSTLKAHAKADFGAVFEDPRPNNVGGWIYLSNSEVRVVGKGGVGAFTFNKNGEVIDYHMVLEGTKSNCGGGRTPWGSWISGEEYDEGRNWQVDPIGEKPPGVITLGNDGGRFESFAYDLSGLDSPQFFVTEDTDDGAMQRFRPDNPNWDDPWNILYGTGKTDFLVLEPAKGVLLEKEEGTYFFTDNRTAAEENAKLLYPNSEGIDSVGGILYFISKKTKKLFILDLNNNTYTAHSTEGGEFDAQPDQLARIVNSDGDLFFFTEDGRDRPGIHARDKDGGFYTILEGLDVARDETTGVALSPDAKHLYFAQQDAGKFFDVTRLDGKAFNAKTLNIQYHAKDAGSR